MFVWDIQQWNYNKVSCLATSIPYWDDICGEIVSDVDSIKNKFQYFLENIEIYQPRKYILDNFKLENQSKKLIDMFDIR